MDPQDAWYTRNIQPASPAPRAPDALPSARYQFMPAIAGLRFFLAFWIILHHLTGKGDPLEALVLTFPLPLYTLIRGGYMAVTTFFVLSGFVMGRTYRAAPWSGPFFGRYMLARVARIYPVYLLSLLVVLPFILADPTPGKTWYLAAHGLLIQAWLGSIPVNWNTPAWALSCEMFFYLLVPLAVIPLRNAGWRKVLFTAAISICLTRWMWAVGVSDGIKPLVHLSDFLMGIAAARAFDLLIANGRPPRGSWLYLPCGFGVAFLIACPGVLPHFFDLNSTLRPLNAGMLIGLGLGGGIVARFLSTRPLIYLGKLSYAIYILHIPLMWWYSRWCKHFSVPVYLAIVFAVSALVFEFVEEPANRLLRPKKKKAA